MGNGLVGASNHITNIYSLIDTRLEQGHEKERNVSRDLPRGRPNLNLFLKIHPNNHLSIQKTLVKIKFQSYLIMFKIIQLKEGLKNNFSFDIKQEKTMTSCDLLVINEDLANYDVVDTIICYKSLTNVMEDYLGVSLHT